MDKTLVVFPRGQLDARQRERLTKSGIIAIEADDPNEVKIIEPTTRLSCSNLSGDAIVSAALEALVARGAEYDAANAQRYVFLSTLNKFLKGE